MAQYAKAIAAGVSLLAFWIKNTFDIEIAEGPLVDAILLIGGTIVTIVVANKPKAE
jgi:hypothetical protein